MKPILTQDDSCRQVDLNGFVEIPLNPISKEGVFAYTGKAIGAPDPDRIYMVYRPAEELEHPETIRSFNVLPIIDDHTMLGDGDGCVDASQKGVHGVSAADTQFDGTYLRVTLKLFSRAILDIIKNLKKDISIGYRCVYDFTGGIWNGIKYDAIQRNIRGNHIAIVSEGRSGRDVSVLDSVQFTFDSQELIIMASKVLKAKLEKTEQELKQLRIQFDEAEKTASPSGLAELAAKIDTVMSILESLKQMESEEAEMQGRETGDEDKDANVEKADGAKEVKDEDDDKMDGKKAEDEDDADKADKKDSMDAAEVQKMIAEAQKKERAEINKRNVLASKLSHFIGSFDASEMSLADVEKYGANKLGLKVQPGHEGTALDVYLQTAKPSKPAFSLVEDSKQDSGKPSKIRSAVRVG